MKLRARDVMQANVRTVRADTGLADLDRILSGEKHSGIPVVDKEDRVIGVVTRTDVVRKLAAEWSQLEYATDAQRSLLGYGETVASEPDPTIGARVGQRMAEARVEDMMSHSPITVTPDTEIEEVARCLIAHSIHRLPVVDADRRLVGIITTTDLVRLMTDGRVEV